MFARKSKSEKMVSPEQKLRELLAVAVDRNTPIGVVRLGYAGEDPLAQGRLLRWTPDQLIIEEVQIIGRDVNLHLGNRVEAYVSFNNVMMTFESKITHIAKPWHLNGQRVVKAMHLSEPQLLRRGDRRSAYRASLTLLPEDIRVKMWFIDRLSGAECAEAAASVTAAKVEAPDEQESGEPKERKNAYFTDLIAMRRDEPIVPCDEWGKELPKFDWEPVIDAAHKEQPHAVGRLVDVSANGLGVLMYGICKMQLNRFERVVTLFDLEDTEVELVAEMRHAVDLRGSTCRVGFLLLHPKSCDMHAPQRRLIEQVSMKIQREHMRSRKAA